MILDIQTQIILAGALILIWMGTHRLFEYIKSKHNFTDDETKEFLWEKAKDKKYNRANLWLNNTGFPNALYHELVVHYSDEVAAQWNKMLHSQKPKQGAGTDKGLAYYWFVIPWIDGYEDFYRNTINDLVPDYLKGMNASVNSVIIEFNDWDLPNYKICWIWYARTADEKIAYYKEIDKLDKKVTGSNFTNVHDIDLDEDLGLFDDKEDEKDHG